MLHLITVLNPGGAENHLLSLTRGLLRRGYQVEVAYLKHGFGKLATAFESSGISVHPLHMRAQCDVSALLRLTRLLRARQYDVIHTHLPRADIFGGIASLLIPKSQLVSSKHNEYWFYDHSSIAAVERWLCRRRRRVITISAALARFYQERCLVKDPSKLRVIHYGLDLGAFDQRLVEKSNTRVCTSLDLPPDARVVLSVGRLEEQKGHRYLIDAFAQVRFDEPRAHLVIAGEGSLRRQLTLQIERLGLQDCVHLLGWRPDVPNLMQIAEVFVLPSLWEGFGLVLLEAMAAHLPVVAFDTSAIPEIVVDGKTGLLVPPRESQALAEGILRLLKDPGLAHEMGQAGRRRVETRFTVDQMVTQTMRVYQELL